MIFVVVNPMNVSDFHVFNDVEKAKVFLANMGFSLLWIRDMKVCPRIRAAYLNKDTKQTFYIYCRALEG